MTRLIEICLAFLPKPLRKIAQKFLDLEASRFAIVGVINTAIDFLLFCLCFYGLNTPLLAANAIGFTAALLNSYFMNKIWTFEDKTTGGKAIIQAILFAIVAIGGLIISSTVLWLLTSIMPAAIAKLLGIIIVMIWNFLLSKSLVFQNK